jgi:hypothetical protein
MQSAQINITKTLGVIFGIRVTAPDEKNSSESEFKIGKPASKYDPLHIKRTVL